MNMRSRATITDVARLAGVSRATVTRVVQDAAAVRPATRSRVQEAITALDYAPDVHAQRLGARSPGRPIGADVPTRSAR